MVVADRQDEHAADRTADPGEWSPSRLALAARCGLAWHYRYRLGIPAPYDNAASLLGNVVHYGVEQWYTDYDYKTTDLAPVVLKQWEKLLPPVVWQRVLELRDLEEECAAVQAAVLFKNPQFKTGLQSKEYLSSSAVKSFNEKRAAMVEVCDALEEIKWPKDEDPYKAYQLSALWAKQMQERWQPLPPPLAVEFPFSLQLGSFRVRGRIDLVRMDPHVSTGEVMPRVIDIKTVRNLLSQMEAFLQAYIYVEAVLASPELPDTTDVAFYHTRKNAYQQGAIDLRRHRALASRILNDRARQIAMGQTEPSYGHWCERCDFRSLCEREIDLWKDDGVVFELM